MYFCLWGPIGQSNHFLWKEKNCRTKFSDCVVSFDNILTASKHQSSSLPILNIIVCFEFPRKRENNLQFPTLAQHPIWQLPLSSLPYYPPGSHHPLLLKIFYLKKFKLATLQKMILKHSMTTHHCNFQQLCNYFLANTAPFNT